MRNLLTIIFIIIILNPEIHNAQTSDSSLNSFFLEILKSNNYISVGACIIKNDSIFWQNAYGYSDLELGKRINNQNIFQLASLSKTVTMTALMKLFERKLFTLDQDINLYLPFPVRNHNFPNIPITFRMLLTHTASFYDVTSNSNKINLGVKGDSDIPLNVYVKELFTKDGKYYSKDYFSSDKPGSVYRYSNISYTLIGYLVELLSNMNFSDFCKRELFIPLEMNNTGWHLKDLDTNKVIYGYGFPVDSVAAYKKIWHFGVPGYTEGMLRTTMEDFSHFILMYLNDGIYKNKTVLKKETVDSILKPQGIKDIPTRSFTIKDIALTWLINDIQNEEYYSMNGFSGSIFTNAMFNSKNKTGFVYFFTGISMQNMQGANEITQTLIKTLKE